jgi:hypothetical protein
MIKKILLVASIMASGLKLGAQSQDSYQDYLKREEIRLAKAKVVQEELKNYINKNIKSYVLSAASLDALQHRGEGEETTHPEIKPKSQKAKAQELAMAIEAQKKQELSEKFLKQNPNKANVLVPGILPASTPCKNFDIIDDNGNINNSYVFRSQSIDDLAKTKIENINNTNYNKVITPASFNKFPTSSPINIGLIEDKQPIQATKADSSNHFYIVSEGNDKIFNGSNNSKNITISKTRGRKKGIMMNDNVDGDYDISSISLAFTVGENMNFFYFDYALVLQQPGHIIDSPHPNQASNNDLIYTENPYFQYRLLEVEEINNKIEIKKDINQQDIILEDKRFISTENNTIFDYYKETDELGYIGSPWTCAGIDLRNHKGKKVMLEVIVGDCARGAHWGIAYINNFRCSNNSESCDSVFGSISSNTTEKLTCPSFPIKINGSFTPPKKAPNAQSLEGKEFEFEFKNIKLELLDFDTEQVIKTVVIEGNAQNSGASILKSDQNIYKYIDGSINFTNKTFEFIITHDSFLDGGNGAKGNFKTKISMEFTDPDKSYTQSVKDPTFFTNGPNIKYQDCPAGKINIAPLNLEKCPEFPITITGKYSLDNGYNLQPENIKLFVYDMNNTRVMTSPTNKINPIITGPENNEYTYSFTLYETDLLPEDLKKDLKIRVATKFTKDNANAQEIDALSNPKIADIPLSNCEVCCVSTAPSKP